MTFAVNVILENAISQIDEEFLTSCTFETARMKIQLKKLIIFIIRLESFSNGSKLNDVLPHHSTSVH